MAVECKDFKNLSPTLLLFIHEFFRDGVWFCLELICYSSYLSPDANTDPHPRRHSSSFFLSSSYSAVPAPPLICSIHYCASCSSPLFITSFLHLQHPLPPSLLRPRLLCMCFSCFHDYPSIS